MNTTFVEPTGYKIVMRTWADSPNGRGHTCSGSEELERDFGVGTTEKYNHLWGKEREWTCDECKKIFKATPSSIGVHTLFSPDLRELQPGDLYYNGSLPRDYYWDNQKGPHLMVVLPNNHHWCIDSRASNCTMPGDKLHRCWVRHGVPGKDPIHVDKEGFTCRAGAGSIIMGEGEKEWHGFLHNGVLVKT